MGLCTLWALLYLQVEVLDILDFPSWLPTLKTKGLWRKDPLQWELRVCLWSPTSKVAYLCKGWTVLLFSPSHSVFPEASQHASVPGGQIYSLEYLCMGFSKERPENKAFLFLCCWIVVCKLAWEYSINKPLKKETKSGPFSSCSQKSIIWTMDDQTSLTFIWFVIQLIGKKKGHLSKLAQSSPLPVLEIKMLMGDQEGIITSRWSAPSVGTLIFVGLTWYWSHWLPAAY